MVLVIGVYVSYRVVYYLKRWLVIEIDETRLDKISKENFKTIPLSFLFPHPSSPIPHPSQINQQILLTIPPYSPPQETSLSLSLID